MNRRGHPAACAYRPARGCHPGGYSCAAGARRSATQRHSSHFGPRVDRAPRAGGVEGPRAAGAAAAVVPTPYARDGCERATIQRLRAGPRTRAPTSHSAREAEDEAPARHRGACAGVGPPAARPGARAWGRLRGEAGGEGPTRGVNGAHRAPRAPGHPASLSRAPLLGAEAGSTQLKRARFLRRRSAIAASAPRECFASATSSNLLLPARSAILCLRRRARRRHLGCANRKNRKLPQSSAKLIFPRENSSDRHVHRLVSAFPAIACGNRS